MADYFTVVMCPVLTELARYDKSVAVYFQDLGGYYTEAAKDIDT